jgi:hypothetical protein
VHQYHLPNIPGKFVMDSFDASVLKERIMGFNALLREIEMQGDLQRHPLVLLFFHAVFIYLFIYLLRYALFEKDFHMIFYL